jgi:hypothetical protein
VFIADRLPSSHLIPRKSRPSDPFLRVKIQGFLSRSYKHLAMAPVLHSANDEAAFMADLLGGLDDSFWTAVPTPDPSPVKPSVPRPDSSPSKRQTQNLVASQRPCTAATYPTPSSKGLSAGEVGVSELLQGAENWDWDDDLLTPQKSLEKSTPRKVAQVGIRISRAQIINGQVQGTSSAFVYS